MFQSHLPREFWANSLLAATHIINKLPSTSLQWESPFELLYKVVAVRTFLAVASGHNWSVHQVDINNAFLHGLLDEDIYLAPPKGSSIPVGKVCKLKRSLYGLKQASRHWNLELTNKLVAFGFKQSQHDHCLFLKDADDSLFSLLVYVDDVLLTNSSEAQIAIVKRFLDSAFTIKDLGPAKYFLGLEIDRSVAGISITQHKFIRDIICDTGLLSGKPASTPLPVGVKLSAFDSPALYDPESYRILLLLDPLLRQNTAVWVPLLANSSGFLTCFRILDFLSLLRSLCIATIRQLLTLLRTQCSMSAQNTWRSIVCDHYKAGFLLPCYIAGKLQLADIFTKLLLRLAFTDALAKLGLFYPSVGGGDEEIEVAWVI
ncbi:UNVERIFIED_CONTAM: putative mitochondrial protein [Sesamum radiatum]|uniref:Mitochondrial protein n=1 Tax=Sesamum radiatum TaxID=300843 RepID=A0AAW2PXZ5_SESRA